MALHAQLLVLALAPGFTQTDEWPQFRGPNGTGAGSGDPPVSWDVGKGENVRWKVPIPGLAHSSPVVWGGRVFVTTAVPAGGEAELRTGWLGGSVAPADERGEWEWRVLCIDRKDGSVLWNRLAKSGVPRFKRHPKSTHANCTPATDGTRVVAFFGAEGMFCYDMDGKPLWTADLGPLNAAWHSAEIQWGFASSPVIYDGKVVVQCDTFGSAFWAALDLATGRELLRVPREEDPTWATPAVHVGARTQVVLNGFKRIAGYDLSTGQELWRLKGGGDIPVPVPVVTDDLIYVTNGHGRSPIYAVRHSARGDITPAGGSTPAGMAWWNPSRGSYMPTPIAAGDVLYVGDDNGFLTAFDARSGAAVYRERLPGGRDSTYSASPVAAGGRLYFTNERGQVDVVRIGRKFEVMASNELDQVCMATPAVSRGELFIRSRTHLHCVAGK
jgi:outer membrane protein assembly factor BamB